VKLNTILKGNTIDILKTLDNDSIDLTITSPPYNKKITKSGKNSIMKPIEYDSIDDNLPEEEYQIKQIDILNEIYRITKPGGSFFYNHKVRHLKGIATHPMEWIPKSNWHLRQEIIWDRGGPVEVGGYRFYQVDERIYWLYKPINDNIIGTKLLSKHARCSSIWKFSPDKKNNHPAPFPLELPLRTILSILDNNPGIVLDPYMGSGTTAVAAKLLNKDFIGIDISDKYINDAYKRIENFEDEKHKLENELEIHKVTKSYKERKAQTSFNKIFDK
jgi:modification methylase